MKEGSRSKEKNHSFALSLFLPLSKSQDHTVKRLHGLLGGEMCDSCRGSSPAPGPTESELKGYPPPKKWPPVLRSVFPVTSPSLGKRKAGPFCPPSSPPKPRRGYTILSRPRSDSPASEWSSWCHRCCSGRPGWLPARGAGVGRECSAHRPRQGPQLSWRHESKGWEQDEVRSLPTIRSSSVATGHTWLLSTRNVHRWSELRSFNKTKKSNVSLAFLLITY